MRDSKTMLGEKIVGRRKWKKKKEKEKKELLGKERESGKDRERGVGGGFLGILIVYIYRESLLC